jgi:hypothetical protein
MPATTNPADDDAEQVTPEPPKKIITPTPGPGHPLAAIYDMIKARNKAGEGSE